jgi:hypothetical protein
MISPGCFGRQLILRKASEIGCRNPVMLEKTIVALQLLGHLAEGGLPIQFKGGSSLLLRLNPIRRLSIDVDTDSVPGTAPKPLALPPAPSAVCASGHTRKTALPTFRGFVS